VSGPKSGRRVVIELRDMRAARAGEVFGSRWWAWSDRWGVRGGSRAGVVVVRGVSGRRLGERVGTMGADVVACMGERLLGSDESVAVRSAAEAAWIALRFAGPGLRL
jgi:hypothetical protein